VCKTQGDLANYHTHTMVKTRQETKANDHKQTNSMKLETNRWNPSIKSLGDSDGRIGRAKETKKVTALHVEMASAPNCKYLGWLEPRR